MPDVITFLLQSTPIWYLIQPLWRDEAFSVLFVAKPIVDIISKSSVEPPLYYILLKGWIMIFGQGEIAVRMLSMVGVFLATVVILFWAEKEFKKHWLSWVTPLLFFFNPMILYYAFEVRAYGWYILFSVLAMISYLNKNWRLFIIASVLGFYTHLYMIFVIATTAIHYVLSKIKNKPTITLQKIIWDPMVRSLILIGFASIAWIIRILQMAPKFKNSWYFPVDLHLFKSLLGNMFLGYEGTPWYFWQYTAYLSIALLAVFLFALKQKNTQRITSYLFMMVCIPLITIMAISAGIKPLFVNRYLIPVTIAQILLLPFAIVSIKPKSLATPAVVFLGIGILLFSIWYPQQHKKMDYRTPMKEISILMKPQDLIYVEDPILYPEALYYAPQRDRVFLYAPNGVSFPWYIGDAIFDEKRATSSIPQYPNKAFVLEKNGSYSILYTVDPLSFPQQ